MAHRPPKHSRLALAGLALFVLAGCVNRPQPLYYWGSFEEQQYAYFTGDKGPEDAIQQMEQTRQEARAQGKALPPGFQAHLGLLYGQTGRTDLFEQNLPAERQQFPESATYVDFLLKKNQKP